MEEHRTGRTYCVRRKAGTFGKNLEIEGQNGQPSSGQQENSSFDMLYKSRAHYGSIQISRYSRVKIAVRDMIAVVDNSNTVSMLLHSTFKLNIIIYHHIRVIPIFSLTYCTVKNNSGSHRKTPRLSWSRPW